MGGRRETLAGLSGFGDLMLTCSSRMSRNQTVGRRLAGGESIKDILASMEEVAEVVKLLFLIFLTLEQPHDHAYDNKP